jgi:hypothetical protein
MSQFVRAGDRDYKVDGGLLRIARVDGEKYRFLGDPGPAVAALRAAGTRVDLLTFLQPLPESKPLYDYPMEWDNFAALPVSTFDQWWNEQIGFKARNKAKQAEKRGVELREVAFGEPLVEGIWEIYNETPVRQGKRFPHYGMTVEQIRSYAGTFLDCSVFLGAFVGERMIGFIKLTWDETRTQAGLMHIVSLVSERDKAPTNALVAHAVRACAERGIAWLVYSNFAYGNKQNDTLSDFKERNGFKKIDIPRYYVPITPLGHLAFRLGLHHKLIDRLPEPLITRLRNLRSSWYDRQLQAAAKTS